MAMNKARRTANLNNIFTYDTLGNSTLIANLTVEGLTGAGFVKADVNGLLSVDTAAYTVVTGATNYLTKITAPNTLGQSLVYDNGTSVYVNSTTGVAGYNHSFTVVANAAGGLVVSTTNTASAIGIVNSASSNKTWDISPFGNHLVINESGVATRIKFDAGGNITIGDITNTGHKLEIVGSFRTTGNNTLSQLSGVGTRMVVVDTNGLLSTQAIATGSVTGTGAAGQVAFWTGTSVQSGSNNLFWDNTNGRLGIGINTPAVSLDVRNGVNLYTSGTTPNGHYLELISNSSTDGYVNFRRSGGANGPAAYYLSGGLARLIYHAGTGETTLGAYTNAPLLFVTNSLERGRFDNVGNFGVGTTTPNGIWSGNNRSIQILAPANFASELVLSRPAGAFGAVSVTHFLSGGGVDLFGVYTASTTSSYAISTSATERLRIWAGGNVTIGGGNNPTDSGQRLQVMGDTLLRGSGATSATIALQIQNSASTNILRFFNDGQIFIGTTGNSFFSSDKTSFATSLSGSGITFYDGSQTTGTYFRITGNNITDVGGQSFALRVQRNYAPTSSNGTFVGLSIENTINQTGGANGITRGLYVNPTLTAAADWRSIEWSNNSGWGLYGAGTAANYLGGALTVNSQITAGNAQATAGSVVLRTTYSSGNISNIGTNGSSGGVTISYGAYPASASTADAFLSGIGFTSFPRSAYAVEADHRWLSAAAALVAEGSAVTLTEKMRLYNSGNLVIQNGGTFTDSGHRLKVSGSTLITDGNLSVSNTGTTSISIAAGGSFSHDAVGTSGQILFTSQNGFRTKLPDTSKGFIIGATSSTQTTSSTVLISSVMSNNADVFQLSVTPNYTGGANTATILLSGTVTLDAINNLTGGIHTGIKIAETFAPNSANKNISYVGLSVLSTINQSLSAQITRGVYVNPTLTVAADWRSIEWSNNSGWGLYGTGTASNYLGGRLGIAVSPTSRLHVAGSGTDATTNSFIAQNSSASIALRVVDNGDVYLGDGEWLKVQGFSKRYIYKGDATNGIFSISSCSSLGATFNMYGATHASKPKTIEIGASYAPNSGTIAYNALEIASNIDQTGTANAITRGLYVNPVLNNAVSRNNWRSIAWTNNEGYGLFGIGTAQNLLSGKLTVNVTVASANLSNSENTISLFGAQTLNIPAATIGTPGVVYAAGTSANYMRFNGNTTMNGDALFAGKVVINSIQFDTTGTVTMSNSAAGGQRALSGLQVQMQFAGTTSGTVTRGASILIQGAYPNNTTGTVTFTDYYGLRINDLLEWDTGSGLGKIAVTNKWAIYQTGINDRNYFAGNMLLNSTSDTGQILQVTGAIRVNNQRTTTSGVASGQFLSINCDGTTYKIQLLNP